MKIDQFKKFGAGGLLSLLLFSCSKEDVADITGADDAQKVVELTNKNLSSDLYYDDLSFEVLQVNTENGLTAQPTTPTQPQTCATVSVTPKDAAQWPKTVTIDFGTAGCTGQNGYLRKGKIIYTLDKKLITTGAVLTINFENYSVNGHKIEGVCTITNNGSLNGLNVTVKLTNGKITYPDGSWYTKTSNKTWVQTAGFNTFTSPEDDEFNLTGNGTITSSAGNTLSGTTKTALLRKYSCANIVSGILELTYNNIKGDLNYGNGECDKTAVLTVAGKDYEIDLP